MAVKIARRIEPTSEQLAASVVLTGASALRMMRAERRQMGYISWRDLYPDEERRVLHTSSPSAEDIYLPDLVRIGAVSGEVQEDLCLLVGSAKQRRRMPGASWSVCSTDLPDASILEVEPGVYSLSPEALCAAVAREVGCIQAFALAQELCSKISLSDRGQYLPPYSSPTVNRLAKDKDQPSDVGYFEVEPVLTPDRLADYLAACKGSAAKQLRRLCPFLSENLRSPMECIMLAMFSLTFSYGGFACGPFKTDTRSSSTTVRRRSRGCRMRFAMPIRKQLGLTWNTTVSRAIRLAAGAFTMKNAIRVWRPWESRSRRSTTRCSATWKRWKRSHGASTSVWVNDIRIV